MDRRRFVPSSEGLEARKLLSTATAAGAAGQAAAATVRPLSASTSGLPESYSQKLQRIENLPFFLEQLQPGRYLPPDTIRSVQDNLIDVTARLHGPPSRTVDSFNLELRDTLAETSLSAGNARALGNAFNQVLVGAGATEDQVTRFTADMNILAQVDSQSPSPTYLAANDYAVILQTALAVGRPIVTPRAPRLSRDDGRVVGGGGGGTTTNPEPTLVGTYEAGASDGGNTRIDIVNADGEVVGSGPVGTDGRYSATINRPLSEGRHVLSARAVDSVGNESNDSPGLILRVVSLPQRRVSAEFLVPPRGPLGLR